MSSSMDRTTAVHIINSIVNRTYTDSECETVLKTLLGLSLSRDEDYIRSASLTGFQNLSSRHPEAFTSVFTAELIEDILENPKHVHRISTVALLLTGLSLWRKHGPGPGAAATQHILSTLRLHLIKYFETYGSNLALASSVVGLYSFEPECLSVNLSQLLRLAYVVVKLLASYPLPNPAHFSDFRRDSSTVADLVCQLAKQESNLTTGNSLVWGQSLSDAYSYLAADKEPSQALCFLLDKVPTPCSEAALRSITQERTGLAGLEVALKRLFTYLTIWPAGQLAAWVWRILNSVDELSLLTAVAESSIVALARSLRTPLHRGQTSRIFFFLLYGSQHQDTVFNKVAALLPSILADLRSQGESAQETRQQLEEAARYLMGLCPEGAPVLYRQLAASLPPLSLSPARLSELQALAWSREKVFCSRTRSPSHALGLMNLGNSCYMNSVLQALTASRAFATHLLALNSFQLRNRPVTQSLQRVVGFLELSLRNLYCPTEFQRSARPPWFQQGYQQDCSEFLIYLLETLQEEERPPVNKIPIAALESRSQRPNNADSVSIQRADGSPAPTQDEHMEVEADLEQQELSRWSTEENLSEAGSQQDLSHDAAEPEQNHSISNDQTESRETGVSSNEKPPLHTSCTSDMPEQPLTAIRRYFGIRVESSLTCHSCGSVSRTREFPWSLGLSIPHPPSLHSQNEALKNAINRLNPPNSLPPTCGDGTVSPCCPEMTPFLGVEDVSGLPSTWGIGTVPRIPTTLGVDTSPPDNPGILGAGAVPSLSPGLPPTLGDEALLHGSPEICAAAVSPRKADRTVFDTSPHASDIMMTSPETVALSPGSVSTSDFSGYGGSPQRGRVSPDSSSPTGRAQNNSPGIATGGGEVNSSPGGAGMMVSPDTTTATVFLSPPSSDKLQASPTSLTSANSSSASPLTLEGLIHQFLEPEEIGDYACDSCNSRVTATKATRILATPRYLTVTLYRFQFDRHSGQRYKILSKVELPFDLKMSLPNQSGEGGVYRIFAVIIHRGGSLDGGHYYTWARHTDVGGSEVWRIYDDAQVETSSWDSLQQSLRRRAEDTPYVLFYEKVGETESSAESPAEEIRELVNLDNARFLTELERTKAPSTGGPHRSFGPRSEDDDSQDGGGGPSGSCGDSFSSFGAGRFVC